MDCLRLTDEDIGDAKPMAEQSCDSIANNSNACDALGEAELGIDNQYNRLMQENRAKREEVLRYKEKRRLEMAEQRRIEALVERQQIEENKRKRIDTKMIDRVSNSGSKFGTKKALSKIDTNVRYHTSANIRTVALKDLKRIIYTKESIEDLNRNGQTCNRSSDSVEIENLSPQTNEYSISAICQTIGSLRSCCIRLEADGTRKAIAHFDSAKDAIEFQKRFHNFKLDSSFIKTRII